MTMPRAVAHHVFSSMFLLAVYPSWVTAGNTMTGHYPLFWVNPNEYGNTGIVAACAFGSVAMSPPGESWLSNDVGTGQCIGRVADEISTAFAGKVWLYFVERKACNVR
jgi:hypothetical protein